MNNRQPVPELRTVHLCGEDIENPGHICGFFASRDEEYSVVLPYLREGADAGETVLNVLDEARLEEHRQRMSEFGIEPQSYSLSSSEETYLSGGRFDMEHMASFVAGAAEAANASGLKIRTAGWMDWIHRELPGTRRVLEYEARMNDVATQYDCTFMCMYDLSKLSGQMVMEIMLTHPYVILKGRVRRNPFYVPPAEYLSDPWLIRSDPDFLEA